MQEYIVITSTRQAEFDTWEKLSMGCFQGGLGLIRGSGVLGEMWGGVSQVFLLFCQGSRGVDKPRHFKQ